MRSQEPIAWYGGGRCIPHNHHNIEKMQDIGWEPVYQLAPNLADHIKVAVCEYLHNLNEGNERPFIPPTAINWLGDGITTAILDVLHTTP